MTVPNGPNDNATFQTSNQTIVSLSADTEVNGIIFNSEASLFEIINGTAVTLTISGTGVTNSSGITQTFFISGHMAFTNASRAGDLTSFDNVHGTITFFNSASAGSATFISYPDSIMSFSNWASAGSATFTSYPGSIMSFSNSSTAESVNVTLLRRNGPKGAAAQALFVNSSSAANALYDQRRCSLAILQHFQRWR